MKTKGNTILITGGATGIGFSLAEAFLGRNNRVLVCGRRQEKLDQARAALPRLEVRRLDVADKEDRRQLAAWAVGEGVNVLINNAGIQREVNFLKGAADLEAGDNEIRCNLEGPVHLTALLTPHLMIQEAPSIINISSGLAFVPLAIVPIYCATKAAMHSFTVSLRQQLVPTPVKVFEVIPPTVNTELDRGARSHRGQKDFGIPVTEVTRAVLQGLEEDRYEITVGRAEQMRRTYPGDFEKVFQTMNVAY